VWDHILPTVSDDEPVAGTVEPATGDAGDQDTSSG
jgi:hypothetical protein